MCTFANFSSVIWFSHLNLLLLDNLSNSKWDEQKSRYLYFKDLRHSGFLTSFEAVV